jgi:uncharacterized membrane protein
MTKFEGIIEEIEKIKNFAYILLAITAILMIITICLIIQVMCSRSKERKASRLQKEPEMMRTKRIYQPYPRKSAVSVKNVENLKKEPAVAVQNLTYEIAQQSENAEYEEIVLNSGKIRILNFFKNLIHFSKISSKQLRFSESYENKIKAK